MDPLLSAGTAFLGFFLSLLVWSRAVRWGHAIWLAFRTKDANAKSATTLPSLLLLHSAPWLIIAFALFCYYIFAHPHRPEWSWFWAGTAAVPPVIALLVLSVLRRIKRAKYEANGPNSTVETDARKNGARGSL